MKRRRFTNAKPQEGTVFLHLRHRNNGIPQINGGITVAILPTDGQYKLAICQCRSDQPFNDKLGEMVATNRLARGPVLTKDKTDLEQTLTCLHEKLCVGQTPRLNLDFLS